MSVTQAAATMVATWVLASTLLAAISSVAEASRFGRNGFSGNPSTNGGVVCTACHAPGAPTPQVTLSGPTLVDAGSTYIYTVEIAGGPAQTAGVNLSISDLAGELAALDPRLQRVGQELSHKQPTPFQSSLVSYRFRWTAPPYNAALTLFAAGNSSNGELDLLGDGIGTDSLRIQVRNGGAPPPQPPPLSAKVTPVLFATGLSRPVAMAHAGDDRLFVAEQGGTIRSIAAEGTVSPTPFLDLRSAVDDSGNEQGLLSLAFHPEHASNGYFYVYYTYDPGPGLDRSRVSRFRVGVESGRADPSSEWVLLEFEQPFANHNAGDLHFGPDGYLYIAFGDGGGVGDPRNLAQNRRSLLGKLLRIDVDSPGGADCSLAPAGRFAIPAGNAYTDGAGGEGCDEIYASGLRNPWRFSFDRQTGDMWIADVGQSRFEEINVATADSGGGLDFGWRCYEGNERYGTGACNGVYLPPIHVLAHAAGNCSVTGGYVYRGFDHPALYGRYFFSDFCNSAIRTLHVASGEAVEETVTPAGSVNTPAAFGETRASELLVASLSAGAIYRLQNSATQGSIVGEAAEVLLHAGNRDHWHQIGFRNRYARPVVVAGPPTSNGLDPTTLRIRNVTPTGFELKLQEWLYLDGPHLPERVGYLVVETGDHRLLDGTRLMAGSTQVDHRWRAVTFPRPFPEPPVVFTTTASARGGAPVTERVAAVSASGFQIRLQEEEAADDRHLPERADWIAIATGLGARHEVGVTTMALNHSPLAQVLRRGFPAPPVVLGELQTHRGGDAATLRMNARSAQRVVLRVEEEQSADLETAHLPEVGGYAAILSGAIRAR